MSVEDSARMFATEENVEFVILYKFALYKTKQAIYTIYYMIVMRINAILKCHIEIY